MANVFFATDLQQFTGGIKNVEVESRDYRSLVKELCQQFPSLSLDTIKKYSLAIDGAIIQVPMLETFKADSELVFVARIAGG